MLSVVQQSGSKARRVARKPRYHFNLETRPYQIAPFMIAPVLPGETMKNLLMQTRVVSDPINNPLIGWWKEHYFFYVKLRDLDGRDDFTEMFTDLGKDLSSYEETASPIFNHHAGAINWTKLCLKRITEEYFRDEGETWNTSALDGLPLASIATEGPAQSAILDDDYIIPDIDVDANADSTIMASEVQQAMQTYEFMRTMNMTNMSFEDYLVQSGVKVASGEHHIPELIRYNREWTYPSNTINPADGAPSSALSWSINSSADKDRFFKEPGFVVGVTVTRPKVYLRNYDGSAVSLLNTAFAWMPQIMGDDPSTSMRKLANTEGPLSVVTDAGGYWIDMKDMFLYGDQFVNYDKSAVTGKNMVDLPTADLSRKYPDSDDVNGFFTSASVNTIREDGIVSLNVLGRLQDATGVPLSAA